MQCLCFHLLSARRKFRGCIQHSIRLVETHQCSCSLVPQSNDYSENIYAYIIWNNILNSSKSQVLCYVHGVPPAWFSHTSDLTSSVSSLVFSPWACPADHRAAQLREREELLQAKEKQLREREELLQAKEKQLLRSKLRGFTLPSHHGRFLQHRVLTILKTKEESIIVMVGFKASTLRLFLTCLLVQGIVYSKKHLYAGQMSSAQKPFA